MSIDTFLDVLRARASTETVTNPYNCDVQNVDVGPDACLHRLQQLRAYLLRRQETARAILVAEAPGYQGARFSGLAMTSERLLAGAREFVARDDILGEGVVYNRTSHIESVKNKAQALFGFSEPTATIVWGEIMSANAAQKIVLWNTFPYHPHPVNRPLKNRRPTDEEIIAERQTLALLLGLFPQDVRLLAIGNIARDHLLGQNLKVTHVRHPANGGATEFRSGLRKFLQEI